MSFFRVREWLILLGELLKTSVRSIYVWAWCHLSPWSFIFFREPCFFSSGRNTPPVFFLVYHLTLLPSARGILPWSRPFPGLRFLEWTSHPPIPPSSTASATRNFRRETPGVSPFAVPFSQGGPSRRTISCSRHQSFPGAPFFPQRTHLGPFRCHAQIFLLPFH